MVTVRHPSWLDPLTEKVRELGNIEIAAQRLHLDLEELRIYFRDWPLFHQKLLRIMDERHDKMAASILWRMKQGMSFSNAAGIAGAYEWEHAAILAHCRELDELVTKASAAVEEQLNWIGEDEGYAADDAVYVGLVLSTKGKPIALRFHYSSCKRAKDRGLAYVSHIRRSVTVSPERAEALRELAYRRYSKDIIRDRCRVCRIFDPPKIAQDAEADPLCSETEYSVWYTDPYGRNRKMTFKDEQECIEFGRKHGVKRYTTTIKRPIPLEN
jgi:hypothetical protein